MDTSQGHYSSKGGQCLGFGAQNSCQMGLDILFKVLEKYHTIPQGMAVAPRSKHLKHTLKIK